MWSLTELDEYFKLVYRYNTSKSKRKKRALRKIIETYKQKLKE